MWLKRSLRRDYHVKALYNFGNVNDQYSHLVYPNICIKSIGDWSCKRIVKENDLFLKNYITSEEAFRTMLYIINSSPLLITKEVFML